MLRLAKTMTVCVLGLVLLNVTSCSTGDVPRTGTAPMDFAMDTAGGRMFYKGTIHIPRGFNSSEAFALEAKLQAWGNEPANNASVAAAKLLKDEFEKKGRFQPLGNGEGEIELARGRLQFRGVVLDSGRELDGEWFMDGEHGGGFRITRQGYLFP